MFDKIIIDNIRNSLDDTTTKESSGKSSSQWLNSMIDWFT